VLRVLSSGDPRITVNNAVSTMTKYTAWIRRDNDGNYEIAPADLSNPGAAGYIKSSLLVTTASGQRTLFPEMRQ
jgi:hypothetical protein